MLHHATFRRLLVAPFEMKRAFLDLIARERGLGSDGRIVVKVNSPGDADVCRAIYEAAAEGVRIDLICRVRPGIAGLSETVSMHSVVGRFLEHSRIFYFGNGEWELPEWVPPLAADHRDSTLRARR